MSCSAKLAAYEVHEFDITFSRCWKTDAMLILGPCHNIRTTGFASERSSPELLRRGAPRTCRSHSGQARSIYCYT